MDSQSCQRFCRLPYGAHVPQQSHPGFENLGKIEPGTWKAINDHLVRWAQARGLEKGQRIRVDATAVQTNVHYPLDSELLYDGIRVVTRWLGRLRDWEGIGFVDHTRRAKRRVLNIRNRPRQEAPGQLPRSDQCGVQDGPLCRAGAGRVGAVERSPQSGRRAAQLAGTIWSRCTKSSSRLNVGSFRARRSRMFRRRSVPSSKSTSRYSHQEEPSGNGFSATKVFVSNGGLVADPGLCGGTPWNPADSNYVQPFLERHRQLYGKVPRQSASLMAVLPRRPTCAGPKNRGLCWIVAFSIKCGLTVESMVRSSWVYKQLAIRFRAGIEGCIGTLKQHLLGLSNRCSWKGWPHPSKLRPCQRPDL